MTDQEIFVIKNSGEKAPFQVEKINRIVEWAVENDSHIFASEILVNAELNIRNNIKTSDIHDVLIESASNLISLEKPEYSKAAAKLLVYKLRKQVWGGKNPPKLYDFIKKGVDKKIYDPSILDFYTEKEINKLDEKINHDRDYTFEYAGLKQLCDKYLVQNRQTGKIFETPQFMYILVAMTFFKKYESNKIQYVKKAYDYFSKFKINLPSPVVAGLRTLEVTGASCCLMRMGDSLKSITKTVSFAMEATSAKYGIGIDMSEIRAIGSPIRHGETLHTGVIPFLKVVESAIKSCKQGGGRRGAGTITFPIFHYEIESILPLKDNTGTEDNRVRQLDYTISMSKLFWDRIKNKEDITLFSSHECPDLYEAFGTPEFDDLYKKYESKRGLKFKKKISTASLASSLFKERVQTGRYYIINVDLANDYSPWSGRVTMGNLCVEVTQEISRIASQDEEVGVCVLAAINMSNIASDTEHEKVCDLSVRMLDELIDIQDYFHPAAENFAKNKRSLGIGVLNLADWLLKQGLDYESPEAPTAISRFFEKQQYYLIKSSCELAKEKGACNYSDKSLYTQGILPDTHYKKDLDDFIVNDLQQDWDALRKDLKEYGIRNATLSAIMPCEASARISGSTNGIEPPRSPITYMKSKGSTLPCLVPSIKQYKKYTYAFNMKSNEGYLKCAAAIQRWTCMAMSTNMYYGYHKYPDGKIPLNDLLMDHFLAYKWGIKTLYYLNTDDGDKQFELEVEVEDKSGCDGGACTI